MKILVRNLARTTAEDEIASLFTPFGAVEYCTLVMDHSSGISKGFAFVEMPKASDANRAIKSLNNTKVDGMRIRVKEAQVKPAETQDQKKSRPEPE